MFGLKRLLRLVKRPTTTYEVITDGGGKDTYNRPQSPLYAIKRTSGYLRTVRVLRYSNYSASWISPKSPGALNTTVWRSGPETERALKMLQGVLGLEKVSA